MLRRFLSFLRKDPIFMVPVDVNEPWLCERHNELHPINRMLVWIKPKKPYALWVSQHCQDPSYDLAKCRKQDRHAFLIPCVDRDIEEGEAFLVEFWSHFFAQMLSAWALNPEVWPTNRTLEMFRHWFEIEIGDWVLDLGHYIDQ